MESYTAAPPYLMLEMQYVLEVQVIYQYDLDILVSSKAARSRPRSIVQRRNQQCQVTEWKEQVSVQSSTDRDTEIETARTCS